ncbi:MAG: ABC transporter permease [Ruminiclostridium sp.]|nr:ABC transporter permease [Ruminiclostridium sp.]
MNLFSVISDIVRGKGRTLLTICSIAVGIFAVMIISAIGRIGTGMINRSLDEMGINSVLVESGYNVNLSDEDVAALKKVDGISKAMPLMASVTTCELVSEDVVCMAWGVSNNADEIISLKALHGRLINESDISGSARVCVVDKEIALQTYGRENITGKTININIGGKYESFQIIGVATSGLSGVQSAINEVVPYFVYLPYTTVQNISGRTNYDKIALLTKGAEDTEVIDRISKCMEKRKGTENILVNNLLNQRSTLNGILSVATSALGIVAAISLVVASMSVMTAMLVSVAERKREIGIKKSLGAKNSRIVGEFLAESVIISVVGSIVGIIAAIGVTALICLVIGEAPVIEWDKAVLSISVSVVIGMISGGYPALKAARMKPVDALKG